MIVNAWGWGELGSIVAYAQAVGVLLALVYARGQIEQSRRTDETRRSDERRQRLVDIVLGELQPAVAELRAAWRSYKVERDQLALLDGGYVDEGFREANERMRQWIIDRKADAATRVWESYERSKVAADRAQWAADGLGIGNSVYVLKVASELRIFWPSVVNDETIPPDVLSQTTDALEAALTDLLKHLRELVRGSAPTTAS